MLLLLARVEVTKDENFEHERADFLAATAIEVSQII